MLADAFLDARRALTFGVTLTWRIVAALVDQVRFRRRSIAWPVVLRRFLEDMGSTYLKLGQYLALRFDLLPPEVCRELTHLFEQVPPVPFGAIKAHVEREFGRPLEDLFASFDPTPIASASIAQVHRAAARDGRRLAVKVQRPGVDRIVAADLRNLRRLAVLGDALRIARAISLVTAVEGFAEYTMREVDFIVEGSTADRLHATLDDVVTPEIIWELSSARVLTMTFIEGISLVKLPELLAQGPEAVERVLPGFDLDSVIRRLGYATLSQLFVTGFFHADPHPGNILVGPNGMVALVDFGIFGQLDSDQREWLSGYVENLALGNLEAGYRCYENLLTFSPQTDRPAFKRGVIKAMADWRRAVSDPAAPVRERHVGNIADRKAQLLFKYHVTFDLNTLLFWRTLIVLDATALSLAPEFDLTEMLREFFVSVRPTLERRILDAGADVRRVNAVQTLLGHAAGAVTAVHRHILGNRVLARVRTRRMQADRAARNDRTRLLGLGLLTVAAWIVIPSTSWRLIVAAGATLLAVTYARRMRRAA